MHATEETKPNASKADMHQ